MQLLLGFIALCIAVGAQAQSGRAQLEHFLASTKTLQARFEQKVFDEERHEISASSGAVFIKKPGRFRWDYQGDNVQTIVADGEKISIYDPDLLQVTIRPLDTALGNTPAHLLINTAPLEDAFLVQEGIPKGDHNWVELKPRRKSATFTSARVGLLEGNIQVVQMLDNFGQLTELTFSQLKRNLVLKDGLFKFIPPPGVDVIREN